MYQCHNWRGQCSPIFNDDHILFHPAASWKLWEPCIAIDTAIDFENGLQTIKIRYILSQGICIDTRTVIKAYL